MTYETLLRRFDTAVARSNACMMSGRFGAAGWYALKARVLLWLSRFS